MTEQANPAIADLWATTTAHDDYDPRMVVTQAYDSTAKTGRKLDCRVTTAMGDAVDSLVARIPRMKSTSDVQRTAIYHYMHFINQLEEDDLIFQPLEQEVRQAEVVRMNNSRAEWDAHINSLDDLLGKLIDEADYETAQHLILRNMDPSYMSPPYQMRMAAVIDKHARRMRYLVPEPETGNHD